MWRERQRERKMTELGIPPTKENWSTSSQQNPNKCLFLFEDFFFFSPGLEFTSCLLELYNIKTSLDFTAFARFGILNLKKKKFVIPKSLHL